MYENMTFETILSRMMERVSNDVDKREGSIIYDALAPAAAELCQMYIDLDIVMKETFADTASREYLILRAKERGITPYKATPAIGKAVFNIAVSIGSRFSLEQFNYKVAEVISEQHFSYKVICEAVGSEPNHTLGTLIPIEYIQGLTSAELVEVLTPGEDVESTEGILKRYLATFDKQAFGGNRADYIEKVTAIPGIGGCKVYRAWNGGGTVKCVIINSDYQKPTESLVNDAQTAVDPIQNQGEGLGIAPIDHVVTIVGVTETRINISTSITYANGWNFTECKPYINETIDKYFIELSKQWADSSNLIARISQIESRLLDLEGIIDIGSTMLNGVAQNYVLGADDIPVRGDVIG
ncbi:baseplate J/gp47 family protein [Anaerotignum sp.]|uniref:baseplate J/gp47 family protein n=1 Tax=Anaerotignum sp. TaxID=2039241 RepID=UPI0028A5DC3D|nr:baseplate J/gp47 family protein [Anaerotignum sp.]